MTISDKLNKMRGILYRKYFEKKTEPIERNTRAAQMLAILKKEPYERVVVQEKKKKDKISKFPNFMILPSKALISFHQPTKSTDLKYSLIRPYAYAVIRWDIKEDSLVYHVLEPPLSDEEKNILDKLKQGLIETINVSFESVKKGDTTLGFLEEHVQNLIDEYDFEITEDQYMKIMYYIYRDFVGLNEVEPFIHDPFIEDISCDGVKIPIYVVHQKLGSLQTNVQFDNEVNLRNMVVKLAERCDRYISYAEPLLDGTLPDGSRVQASLASDVTTKGPTFTIRKFRDVPFTPVDMVELGTASPEMLAYLWFIVEQGRNILICGGVSTGKTSFLNNLSLFIPPDAKIVSIEDTRELNLPHANWIPAVARTGFGGTKIGEVDMFELLRESFRQNPDYLVVGEVRGKEASVMFQGLASGHPGISTIHAGSVDDVIKRLETPPINLSPGLLETLDLIIVMVHAKEKGKSARRVKKVVELLSIDKNGKAETLDVFTWNPTKDDFEFHKSKLLEDISAEKGLSMENIKKDIEIRKKIIEWMIKNRPKTWQEIAKYIAMFQSERARLFELVGIKDDASKFITAG